MLNLRPHAGLGAIGFLVGFRQRAVPIGSFVGEVLHLRRQGHGLEPHSLFYATVGAVAVKAGFLTVNRFGT